MHGQLSSLGEEKQDTVNFLSNFPLQFFLVVVDSLEILEGWQAWTYQRLRYYFFVD